MTAFSASLSVVVGKQEATLTTQEVLATSPHWLRRTVASNSSLWLGSTQDMGVGGARGTFVTTHLLVAGFNSSFQAGDRLYTLTVFG